MPFEEQTNNMQFLVKQPKGRTLSDFNPQSHCLGAFAMALFEKEQEKIVSRSKIAWFF